MHLQLAYLTVSLLLDPASELSIMVVATIQADLRSDNFLTAATALSAICHIVTPELVGVFLPQVVALLRHAKDAVKQKALLALQRCLQVDPSLAPEVERHLIEKIGYKVCMCAVVGEAQMIADAVADAACQKEGSLEWEATYTCPQPTNSHCLPAPAPGCRSPR